jgi:putative DNA primase/helicase
VISSQATEWAGRTFRIDSANYREQILGCIQNLDGKSPGGIYLRTSTIGKELHGGRGGNNDSISMPGFWLDMDIDGPGHKPAPVRPGQPAPLPLPNTESACWQIIEHSGMPHPSLWLHSGGGMYPWWFFDDHHILDGPESIDEWKQLSHSFHTIFSRAAADLGWRVGTESHEPARVLRIPGTVNRKVDGAWTQARFFHEEINNSNFSMPDMQVIIKDGLQRWPDLEPKRVVAMPAAFRVAATGVEKPGDAYNREMTPDRFFRELLEPEGWQYHSRDSKATYLTRPGKNPRAGLSASLDLDGSGNLFIMSAESAPFNPNEPVTPFHAYATFHHGGDYKAAAKELGRQGYGTPLAQVNAASLTQFSGTSGIDLPPVTPVTSAATSPVAEEPAETSPVAPKWRVHSFDDRGNARRLYDRYADHMRWISATKRWALWDGKRWATDNLGNSAALQMAGEMTDVLMEQEGPMHSQEPNPGTNGRSNLSDFEKFCRHLTASRSTAKLEAMLQQLKGLPGMTAEMEAFDQQWYFLNLSNGILDVRTSELHPHSPNAMVMNQARVAWNPEATAPKWQKFLERVQPDPEKRSFLQRVAGYSSTGSMAEQSFFIHTGNGMNGKSVFIKIMSKILGGGGNGYHQVVPRSTLLAKRSDQIPADIARMVGKRWLDCAETQVGRHLDEEVVKALTSDRMVARALYGDFFEFEPTAKVHLVTNCVPIMSDSKSIWRRVAIIEWTAEITEEEEIPNLDHILFDEEAEGILVWMVEGIKEWMKLGGLKPPQAIQESNDSHRAEMDPIGEFLAECCELGEQFVVASTELYSTYRRWAEDAGYERRLTRQQLVKTLKERDRTRLGVALDTWRNANTRGLRGVRVRPYRHDTWVRSGAPVSAYADDGPEDSQPSLE